MIKDKYTYKLTYLSFLRPAISPIILLFVLIIIYAFLFQSFVNVDNTNIFWIIFMILFALDFVPPLILHINYYLTDKDKKITIDKENGIIIYSNGDKLDLEFKFSDIKTVELVKKMPFFRLPINGYYYYKIFFEAGHHILISSMINFKLERYIDKSRFEEIFVYFPLIKN